MDLLTKESCQAIRDNIINDNGIDIIKKHFIDYYISIEEKKGTPASEDDKARISQRVNNVFNNIKYIVIPTNIKAFNINNYISKQENTSTEQKQAGFKEISNAMDSLNSERQTKIFKAEFLEAFGYHYDDVYIKGQYFPKPGPKYQEFLDLVTSITNQNIDHNSNLTRTDALYQNFQTMAEVNKIHKLDAEKYYNNLICSGGFCYQPFHDEIDIIINAGPRTAVSSIVHETAHAMSYYEYSHRYESGFNTENEKGPYGFRRYQLFNEVVNQFLTRQVLSTFSDEELAQFGVNISNENIYDELMPLMEDFLKEHETDLVDCLNSPGPIPSFSKIIGRDNFETIVNQVNAIQGKLYYKYDNNEACLLDKLEKMIKQYNPQMLNGQPLTIPFIKENLKFFQNNYGYMPEAKSVFTTMEKMDTLCKTLNEQHQQNGNNQTIER